MSIRRFFRNYIDRKYPNWDLSIALRYLPIVEDIKKNQKPSENILEVGSEITGITPYLQRPITGVDLDFDYSKKNKYLKPVKGSVLDLPFPDHSFDYVLSVDMLEHIPPKLREKAIEEMVRVTKKKLYLSFPSGKESEEIDKKLYEYYLKKRNETHQYLKEHTDFGLPKEQEVQKILKNYQGFRLAVYNNTSLWLWEYLLKFGLSGEKLKSSLYRRSLLLLPFLKHFNFGKTYRKLFVLEKIKQ